MVSVFFSYSHADEDLRDMLEKHLSVLKKQGLIDAWHDRRIIAGDEWAGEISDNLEKADVILLLVSSDFLASTYCYDIEMTRAMERHAERSARVIPVILRHCDWHDAPFGRLQATPKNATPIKSWPDIDEAFLDVVKAIKAALPKPAPAVSPPASTRPPRPAAELRPMPRSSNLRVKKEFTEADRDRFLDEAFAYMQAFFENSLKELTQRNPSYSSNFRRIDANRFTAVIYRDGKAVSRCKITLGGSFGHGISFSHDDRDNDNSYNESLSVEADDQAMFLKPIGMQMFGGGQRDTHLSFEGAAELYWGMLVSSVQ